MLGEAFPIMLEQYFPILLFILVAAAFPLATLLLARVVRPANYAPIKGAAYECERACSGAT